MINADKARAIQRVAQAEQDAHVKVVIEGDVEVVCDAIEMAARSRKNFTAISALRMSYPKDVAEYLQTELGYTAKYSDGIISVSW